MPEKRGVDFVTKLSADFEMGGMVVPGIRNVDPKQNGGAHGAWPETNKDLTQSCNIQPPSLSYMCVAVLYVFCWLFLYKYSIYYIIKSKTDRQHSTELNNKSGNMAKLSSNTWSMSALCEALIKQYLLVNPSNY